MKKSRIIFIVFLLIFSIFFSNPVFSFAQAADNTEAVSGFPLTEGWKYRWGDSPLDSTGVPLWLTEDTSSPEWKALHLDSIPLNLGKHKNMWISNTLPKSGYPDPVLLIGATEQSYQVYIEDRLIHEYGDMARTGHVKVPGTTWQEIRLPQDFQGSRIYIRLYSPYTIYTGYINTVLIAGHEDASAIRSGIQTDDFKREIDYIILAGLFILIGLTLSVVFFIRKMQYKEFISLGISTALLGIWILTESKLRFIFFDSPIIWIYLAYFSIQLMPIGFCKFVEKTINCRDPWLGLVPKVYIIYTITVFILDFSTILSLAITIRIFHFLLLATMIAVIKAILPSVFKGVFYAKVLIGSFSVLSLSGLIDMADRFYFRFPLLQGHHLTQWAMFFFILSLIYIIAHRFMDIHNELKRYSKDIEMKNMALNHMFEELKNSKEKITKWSDVLEQAVIQKTTSIRNLLNSAGQGFLSFGDDLVVHDEYSSLCIEIFGGRVEKKYFPELVFLEDDEQKVFLGKLLNKIFSEDNASKREILTSLLPSEAIINERNMHIDFKLILENGKTETIMVVLTDISDKRKLENQIEQERNLLKMVVKIVVNSDDFINCFNDYTSFCKHGIFELLQSGKPISEIILIFFRTVHTFKGNFSQLDAVNIVTRLHELETALIELNKNSDYISFGELRRFILELDLQNWLDMDFAIIRSILGEEYLKQLLNMDRSITIDKLKIIEIEKRIMSVLTQSQQRLLLPQIRKLRYKPFKSLLKTYPEFVAKLSERLEKPVNSFVIEGGDIAVFPDIYTEFAKALVHIFRNMVDHGLETSEERLEKGKSEFGTIKCEINQISNKIFILISDDGRGIDTYELRKKAIERNIISEELSETLSDSELHELIFTEGISTKQEATEYSGRGIGLSAVKTEVEKLGGSIKVISQQDVGTEFHIFLPFEDIYELPELSIYDIIYPLVDKTKRYIESQTKNALLSSKEDLNVLKTSELSLYKYTAFISLKGVIEGRIAISFDNGIAASISGELLEEGLSQEERDLYIEDSIAECSNIILGNSMKKFAGRGEMINIDSPVVVSSEHAVFRYPEQKVWTCKLSFDSGNISISFLLS